MDERIRQPSAMLGRGSSGRAARRAHRPRIVDVDVACPDPEPPARLLEPGAGAVFPSPSATAPGGSRSATETPSTSPAARGEHRGRPRHARLHGECARASSRRGRSRRSLSTGRADLRAAGSGPSGRGVHRRPSSPLARSPPRGRARLPARRADRGARARTAAGWASRPASGSSASSSACAGRLPPCRRARPARAAGRLGGRSRARPIRRTRPATVLVAVFRDRLRNLPISNELRQLARTLLAAERPADDSPREIHRFRRRTEPWALSALAFIGATDLYDAVLAARVADRPSRSCAAATCSTRRGARARRSAVCSSSSPRSARPARSRPVTRRSSLCAAGWPASGRLRRLASAT